MTNTATLLRQLALRGAALKSRGIETSPAAESHSYEPRGNCARVQDAEDREIILTGPRGTGKSRAWLEKLYSCALGYPGFRGLIIRKVRADLPSTALLTFERDVLGYRHPLVIGGPRRRNRATYDFANGSQIMCGGMDRPSRVLSAEYDLVYFQQAGEASVPDWEALFGCLRSWIMPYQQVGGCCNPWSPLHWIKQRKKAKLLELWETYHKDNPRLWDGEGWTEKGEEYLALLDRLTGARKARLRHGIWASMEGAIYEIFDEERHKAVSFPIPMTWPRVVGIDPLGAYVGALWGAFDPVDRKLHIYREYLQPFGVTTPEHAKAILKLTGQETVWAWVVGAPSENQARLDWAAAGIPGVPPPAIGVWEGIDRVIQLLADGALVVHDACVNLLSEIGSYRRKLTRGGEPTEVIEKKSEYHGLDCLRYLAAHLLGPKEEVEVLYAPARIGPDW